MEKIDLNNYEAWFLDYSEGNLSDGEHAELQMFLEKHPELRAELEGFEPVHLSYSASEARDWSGLKMPDLQTLHDDAEKRDEFFIRAVEGTLVPEEQRSLEALLQVKKFADEFDVWQRVRLEASPHEKLTADTLYRFGLDCPLAGWNYESWLTAKTEGLLDANQLAELEAFAAGRTDGARELRLADRLRLQPAQGVFYPDKSHLYKSEERKVISLWVYRAAAVAAAFLIGYFVLSPRDETQVRVRPLAEKIQIKPAEIFPEDTLTIKKAALPDTLRKNEKGTLPALEEWQMREPDPTEYANAPSADPAFDDRDSEHLKPVTEIEIDPMNRESVEPELAQVEPEDWNEPAESNDPQKASVPKPDYKTLPQIAEKALAKKLNVPEESQDEVANVLARRLTDKMSKALDTEFTTATAQAGDENTVSYTLRIGGFEFSRTKQK